MFLNNIIKMFFLFAFSLFAAMALTPFFSKFLYKHKMWRKRVRDKAIDGGAVENFQRFHKEKEIGTPRLGGVLIWGTTIIVIFLFFFLSQIFDWRYFQRFNFFTRSETWLPLAVLVAASLLGLLDDILQIYEKGKYVGGGLRFTRRLAAVFLIGVAGAYWFYFKLGGSSLHIPGNGDIELGLWYLPLFILVVLACWSGGVIDGIDGLAGGSFSIMFGAFSIISFANGQFNLAAFCLVISGATMAFLWFNVPPARFYMGESGSIGLTATLAVVAFLTNSVLVLPIIGGLLVLESGSVIIQLFSKKFFKKKVFLAAPFHHHLEAKGWSKERITMRFWIVGLLLAIIGVAVRLLG